MNENDKLYIKLAKKEMVNALESGELNPEQQYAVVNATVHKLLLIKDDGITKTVKQYVEDQDKLDEQVIKAQENIKKLMDEYADNVKGIYENIKEL